MNGHLPTSLYEVLACAALSPKCDSLLIWDPLPEAVSSLALAWTEMISIALQQPTRCLTIGPAETEEVLWGNWRPVDGSLKWQPGLLADEGQEIPVYCVHDLAALELPVQRALLSVIDADVVDMERHGQSCQWQPRGYWIAGCAQSDAGQLSPHFLDRFSIRVSLPNRGRKILAERRQELSAHLSSPRRKSTKFRNRDLEAKLKRARFVQPNVSIQALQQVYQCLREAKSAGAEVSNGSDHYSQSFRRALGLTRMAIGFSRLSHKSYVSAEDVDAVAKLLGFGNSAEPASPTASAAPEVEKESLSPAIDPAPAPSPEQPNDSGTLSGHQPADQLRTSPETEQLLISPTTQTLPDIAAVDKLPLFIEDTTSIARDSFSLRYTSLPTGRRVEPRGPIIGSQPTTDFKDLAVSATLIEAAKFQKIRGYRPGSGKPLKISSHDLRRHRRLPLADHLSIFVIDYTSVSDSAWQQALLPYLHDAYINRAKIAVVKVGASTAANLLRAELIEARNLLAPSVAQALNTSAGSATPLAHGLYLAQRLLRRTQNRGRLSNVASNVVVVTDGRGNVPLQASFAGVTPQNVNRQGIDDALKVANSFCELKRMQCVVVTPTLIAYRQLPEQLAVAMHAKLSVIKSPYELWSAASSGEAGS